MEEYKTNQIKNKYGIEMVKKIRTYEKISKKFGRHQAHLYFNMQCKHTDIIPGGLSIKHAGNSAQARKIIHQAEKALLNLRVGEIVRKKAEMLRQKQELDTYFQRTLAPELCSLVMEKNNKRRQKELVNSSKKQKNKYMRMKTGNRTYGHRQPMGTNNRRPDSINSQQENNPHHTGLTIQQDDADTTQSQESANTADQKYKKRWVKNLSQRELSTAEFNVLSKGGNFAIAPKSIPFEDYIVATEEACKNNISSGAESCTSGRDNRDSFRGQGSPEQLDKRGARCAVCSEKR